MGADSMFEILLNSLGDTAVYVVRKDDYRILYFNDIVGEMVPGIRKGDFCRELWTGYKEACIFSGIGNKKPYSALGFDETFGATVMLTASEIEWGEKKTPAFAISVKPYAMSGTEENGKEEKELLLCAMRLFGEVFLLDISTGRYLVYKSDGLPDTMFEEADFCDFNRLYGENLIHPHDRQVFYDSFALENIRNRARERQQMISAEVRRKDRSGEYRYCELIGIFYKDREGISEKMMLTYRDTDELAKARIRERQANRRFARAVNESYDEIYEGELYTDYLRQWKGEKSTPYFRFSPSFSEQIKWAADTIVHPEEKEVFLSRLSPDRQKEDFENGKSEVTISYRRLTSSGSYRWHSLYVRLSEMTTDCIRVMLYLKDIDDVKKEEERKQRELQNALAMAEKANEAKTDFLSRMSHDIRTPMNVIVGMASVARFVLQSEVKGTANLQCDEKTGNYAKLLNCLEKIEMSSAFLLSLINDILDMSKIESGKMKIANREMNLKDAIRNIKVMIEAQAEERRQTFLVSVAPEVGEFYYCDSLRLNQILLNLLGNALKYTPEQGEIRLCVTAGKVEAGEQLIWFIISDTGIGMSEEFMARMFDPFEQQDFGGSRIFEGTGLGLSISRKLVELLNGTISAESEPGKGTVFTVKIPMKISDKKQKVRKLGETQHRETDREDSLRNKRVLLVEDNEINREIAVMLLEQTGIRCQTAVNGAEGVSSFEKTVPGWYDAILMDIRMPVLNGIESAKKIREMERRDAKTIPIIAMTANAFSEEREEALEAGINDYLTKPIDAEVMYACLRNYMRR